MVHVFSSYHASLKRAHNRMKPSGEGNRRPTILQLLLPWKETKCTSPVTVLTYLYLPSQNATLHSLSSSSAFNSDNRWLVIRESDSQNRNIHIHNIISHLPVNILYLYLICVHLHYYYLYLTGGRLKWDVMTL